MSGSEVLCGRFAREYQGPSQEEVLVATKFAPLPHRFLDGRKSVQKALRASLQRLGTDRVDLYQLHWPVCGHVCGMCECGIFYIYYLSPSPCVYFACVCVCVCVCVGVCVCEYSVCVCVY
jgi:hypothetical protein